MEDKIKFFEEALAADPRSTLFYRLAKLYIEKGEGGRAVAVLRQGLEVHPDHLRANVLLVSLLLRHEENQQALEEVKRVSQVLEDAPEFWLAWAENLGTSGHKDAALAVSFLASHFKGEGISWSGLLEQGLKSMTSKAVEKKSHEAVSSDAFQELSGSGLEASSEPEQEAEVEPASAEGAEEFEVPTAEDISLEDEPQEEVDTDEDMPPDASIRTKSMADILVEQGEYAQALEIYQELLDASPDDEVQRVEIEAAVADLKEKLSDTKEKKLLKTLERLAERLESRVKTT